MKKDLIKIKKHSSELFLKRNQTNPKDVKLHNDVEVSFALSLKSTVTVFSAVTMKVNLCGQIEIDLKVTVSNNP